MAFPETWLNELMNRNDIVSVVSEYTRLSPKGGVFGDSVLFIPSAMHRSPSAPTSRFFIASAVKPAGA